MNSIKDEFERDFERIKKLRVPIGMGELRDQLVTDFKSLENELDECARIKANKERIQDVFDEMRNRISRTEDKVVNMMASLSEQEQNEIATFWEEAAIFLNNIIHWIFEKFVEIVKLLLKGIIFIIRNAEWIVPVVLWIVALF